MVISESEILFPEDRSADILADPYVFQRCCIHRWLLKETIINDVINMKGYSIYQAGH